MSNDSSEDEFDNTQQLDRPHDVAGKREIASAQRKNFAEKSKKLADRKEIDTVKRYSYLLGQTDIFAHFIHIKKEKGEDVELLDQALQLAKSTPKKSDKKQRKTEKEEDEELLKDGDHSQAPTTITESPEFVKGGIMRDYQIQGLNWLISLYENGINGILADEMGLGKTLQTISFIGYLKHFQNIKGPHLVIVPKSTLHNWMSEFKRWCPSIDTFMFHGMKEERGDLVKNKLMPGDFEVCVTSFEMCLLEKTHMKKFSWEYIIIDEAHRIKNENSALSQIVRLFPCRNRLLLTGTPLQNNLHELWALLNFLLPDVFSSSDDFDKWFETQGGDESKVVDQLHKVLNPFLLRRIKAEVEKSLLPKKKINLYVGMSQMQRKWYQKLLERDLAAVNGATKGRGKEGKTRLLNIVMQLRKCCNHPYLFDGAEPGPPYTTDQHIIDNCGKMAILDRLLDRLKASGSRVLLFSQMSRMIDILEDYCVWKQFDYCRIDGNTPHEDRVSGIDEFNKPDSKKFIFLLTTRAGGLGINLATADIVVMFDSDWNPQADLQAEDRAHRIGQKKQVVVFRFITENTVEERVIDKATQKLRLDQLVIQQGRAQQVKSTSKEDLLSMIQYGAGEIFASTESTIATEDIEEILRRSEVKTKELDAKYGEMGFDDLQKFTVGESVYKWEGEDFSNKRKADAVGLKWIQPPKRERKANYGIDQYYKETLKTNTRGPNKATAPKPPKFENIYDFQFYPAPLSELLGKEILAFRKSVEYKIPIRAPEAGETEESVQELINAEQALIDNAEPITEEDIAEKQELLKHGFGNWTKKDFAAFVKACEKSGRDAYEAIAADIETKTVEEVKAYSDVFWKRYTEIADYEKVIFTIERGEARLKKMDETQELLTAKIAKLRNPLHQLKINYGGNKGKNYTEEEDRFLLVMLEKYGYTSENVYENIRQDIKKCPMFRFDWFFKSRTSAELARRCQSLIGLFHKEAGSFSYSLEDRGSTISGRGRGRGRGQPIVKL